MQSGVLAPEQKTKDGEHHRRKGWHKAPPGPMHHEPFHPAGFSFHCCQQALARALRRSWANGGKSEHCHIGINLAKFAPACLAILEMATHLRSLLLRQLAHREEHQIVDDLLMVSHAASTFRRLSRAARMRVLTVPSGSPLLLEISEWVSPSKNAISSGLRCSMGRRSTAARIFAMIMLRSVVCSRRVSTATITSSIPHSGRRRRT